MESVGVTAEQNGEERADIRSPTLVADIEEAAEVIVTSTAVEASDCDSASTTKVTPDGIITAGIVPVTELQTKEEEKECSKREDYGGVGTVPEEQNGITDLSNLGTSTTLNEDARSNVIVSFHTGDESKLPINGEVEQPKTNGNIELQSESKVATSLGIEKFGAVSDKSTIDPAPISPLANTDCDVGRNTTSPEEPEASHSPTRGKGFLFRSTNKEVDGETSTIDPVSYQRKRILRLKRSDQQRSSSLELSSLPIDSLHSIASFLEPIEWKRLGQCNKATNKICREIFRRVRMHGFRCATEVVTAWKFGEHSDAKELCGLYISSGVPIYPHSLGHSYHTLVWKLSIEAKHLQEKQKKEKEDSKNAPSPRACTPGGESTLNINDRYLLDPYGENLLGLKVDSFYNDRDNFRRREDLVDSLGQSDLTYLEEKSLFKNLKTDESKVDITWSYQRRTSAVHRRARNPPPGGFAHAQGLPQAPQIPPPLPLGVPGGPVARSSWVANPGTGRSYAYKHVRSQSFSGNCYRAPNVTLKIHRHLLDQHLLGRSAVNDVEGAMTTPTVSLSADFFHPYFSFRPSEDTIRNQTGEIQVSGSATATSNTLLPAYNQLPVATMQQMDNINHEIIGEERPIPRIETRRSNLVDDSDSDAETEMAFPAFVGEPPHLINANEMVAAGAAVQPPAMAQRSSSIGLRNPDRRVTFTSAGRSPEIHTIPQVAAQGGLLSNTDMDVYSASYRSKKSDNLDTMERQLKNYLKARFTVYHCCLERHLLNNDSDGFEETIMDFWDEFFPQTANIQYYDFFTAVPRISRLEKFLTKPCPKQIGTVQCEIERVKLNSKKKGVNMKGRFFPTYEYRLFIRHRPDPTYDDNNYIRRDTVLMTAKNRGRKHSDNTAQVSKKGSNNYYLGLPQQDDLDLHYKSANGLNDPMENSPNGVGTNVDSSEFSGLVGRLQSNFVGTEFQIFTPRSISERTKSHFFTSSSIPTPHRISSRATSDENVVFDNGRQSELNSTSSDRPRSRFGRLPFRGKSGNNGAEFPEPFQRKPSPLHLRRSRSSDAAPGRNRKVSAAESFFESQHFKTESQRTFFEEEDGAITYTANLLGSRPRIMDVCIPKVNPNGTATEWRRYLENCKDDDITSSADRLLNHLKRLQQNGQTEEHARPINPANSDEEAIGADEQHYSPPSDYGLLALQNRPPWWNVELGSFVLNFGGRVSVASVKNFQLCDRNEQDHIMLQFGRIEGRHSFTMDFQYPLTAVQAFAIAISSLQSKISFG